VLDAALGQDEYVGAYVALCEQLEAALLAAARAATTDPVLAPALDLMLRDKLRHAQFGWLYLAQRQGHLDAATHDAIARRVREMLDRFYAGGLMVPGFAPDIAGDVAAAQEKAAAAGLGIATLGAQRQALRGAIEDARTRFATLGVDDAGLALPG